MSPEMVRAWRAATQACLIDGKYVAPTTPEQWERALSAAFDTAKPSDRPMESHSRHDQQALAQDIVHTVVRHSGYPEHHFRTAARELAARLQPLAVAKDDARAVLQELLDHVDETTCTHESTHRGGAIWTICDNCDEKWADDRGGFKPHEDAPAVAKARALLASEPPATPDAIAWIRYCSDGTYEGPIHDSQMDDIRRKSGAWTPLGRLRAVPDDDWHLQGYAYASKQATNCAGCGQHKHTPLRIDAMGGYVCLTCIDKTLGSLLGEFGYPANEQAVAPAIPDTLPEFLEWVADELLRRDPPNPANFSAGVSGSLKGRAILLRKVSSPAPACARCGGHTLKACGSNQCPNKKENI